MLVKIFIYYKLTHRGLKYNIPKCIDINSNTIQLPNHKLIGNIKNKKITKQIVTTSKNINTI